MNSFSLENRVALVTGSSHGIGRAIARGLGDAGARVILHGLEPDPPEPIRSELYLHGDLSEPDTPAKLLEKAFQSASNLDILVANAGSFFDLPFLEMDLSRWEKTLNLNLRGTFLVIQAFAKRLVREKRQGAVVVVASTNAFQGERDSVAYDASKGALISLVRAAALDLADHRIRVNAVAPGVIRTPLTRRWIETNEKMRLHYEKNVPLGRIGEPEDCAGAAVFLASEAARYVTGQVIVVDGGLTAQQIGKL